MGTLGVIVCGSRVWDEPGPIITALESRIGRYDTLTVITGGAAGADSIAASWAATHAVSVVIAADWATHGRRAGPVRNQQMLLDLLLEGQFDTRGLLAFKEGFDLSARTGRGTEQMVRLAQQAGLPTIVFPLAVSGRQMSARLNRSGLTPKDSRTLSTERVESCSPSRAAFSRSMPSPAQVSEIANGSTSKMSAFRWPCSHSTLPGKLLSLNMRATFEASMLLPTSSS